MPESGESGGESLKGCNLVSCVKLVRSLVVDYVASDAPRLLCPTVPASLIRPFAHSDDSFSTGLFFNFYCIASTQSIASYIPALCI